MQMDQHLSREVWSVITADHKISNEEGESRNKRYPVDLQLAMQFKDLTRNDEKRSSI